LTRLRGRSRFGEAKARASILLRKNLPKGMDGRVKPGNDVGMAFFGFPALTRHGGTFRFRAHTQG
jgi:hypothetical protein